MQNLEAALKAWKERALSPEWAKADGAARVRREINLLEAINHVGGKNIPGEFLSVIDMLVTRHQILREFELGRREKQFPKD